MKFSNRRLLTVELLESRDCPSVNVQVIGGNLFVFTNSATQTLGISQTDANTYHITENGNNVGDFSGVSGSLYLTLGIHSTTAVNIDFNGFGTIKDVNAFLGNGTNDLTIQDGTITRNLFVWGGWGKDQVILGGDGNSLTVNGGTTVNLFSGSADSFQANAAVDLKGNLSTSYVENITLDGGSLLENSAFFVGGPSGNTLSLNGAINGSVWFSGSNYTDSINATGSIGQDLALFLLGGNDSVNFSGSIGRNLSVNSALFGGSKTLNLGGSVGNNASIALGWGGDKVNFSGTIVNNFYLNTGAGDDSVTFATLSSVKNAYVSLSWGDDTFCLQAGAIIVGDAYINGGPNRTSSPGDTFITPLAAVPGNVHLSGFETTTVLTAC